MLFTKFFATLLLFFIFVFRYLFILKFLLFCLQWLLRIAIPDPGHIFSPEIPGLSIPQSWDFEIEKHAKNCLIGSEKSSE